MFDPREIKQQPAVETKNTAAAIASGISFPEFLFNNGNGDLSAFAAIQMYMDAMPLFNAVQMRAEAFSQIPVRVWDKEKEEFVDSHPALDLLAEPNIDVSQMEFLEQVASYYDITGNSFIVATGRLERPPLELMTVSPVHIAFGFGNKFGILNVPNNIDVNLASGGSDIFVGDEVRDLGLRYSNGDMREIWHMRAFNPLRSSTNFWGLSKARPLWFEIQQYLSGNITNLSMLKRGTKLSLAWVNNRGEELSDTQWSRLQQEAQKYMGDVNAGGTPILDGMDVKPIQQTNRDMEFKDLQEAMLSRISTVYGIPLAMLLAQSMTLNNLETSMLQFFDNSVLPLTDRLYNEMTRFILRRYPNSENLEFKFNEHDITALRLRMIETAKSLNEINVNTIDEVRSVVGFEPMEEGGDVILKPATLIPVGTDLTPTEPEPEVPAVTGKFRALMRQAGYSEKAIEDIIKKDLHGS